MGGGDSRVEYVTQYVPDPAAQAAAAAAQKACAEMQLQLKKVEEEAILAGKPELYAVNSAKLMDTLVEKLPTMKLTEGIQVKTGENHIGVIGNISVGKTTLLNVLFGLKLPVSMDHCTEGCEVVHKQGANVYWDVAGKNDDFRFYDPASLSFVKSLSTVVILYDSDMAMTANMIRVASKINTNIVLVRTKVDQYRKNDLRTVEQIRERDATIAKTWLTDPQIYFVSAHNITDGGERFDWDALEKRLK